MRPMDNQLNNDLEIIAAAAERFEPNAFYRCGEVPSTLHPDCVQGRCTCWAGSVPEVL